MSTKYGLLSSVAHLVGATDGASVGADGASVGDLLGTALGAGGGPGVGAMLRVRGPAPQPPQLNSHSTASMTHWPCAYQFSQVSSGSVFVSPAQMKDGAAVGDGGSGCSCAPASSSSIRSISTAIARH